MKSKKFLVGLIVLAIVLTIVFSSIILVVNVPILEENEDKEKEMFYIYRFQSLEITSAKLPIHTHLFLELSNGHLLLVDSTSQTDLLISDDKCANWDTINTGDFTNGKITRTRKIQACWYDRDNGKIYFVDCNQNDTQLTAWYLTIADYTITEMGTYVDASTYAYDIWKFGTDFFITAMADNVGQKIHILKWVDPNWIVRDNDEAFLDIGYMSQVTYPGGIAPTFIVEDSIDHIQIWVFDDSIPDFYHIKDIGDNLNLPIWNMRAIPVDFTDDGFHFVLLDTNDSKNYLYYYHNATITKLGEYNIALMLDRNCSGVTPNKMEKGFGITNKVIYEIVTRRGGIMLLQDCSDLTDANIIAITDNFFMNNDGDMFEYTNCKDDITYFKITEELGMLSWAEMTIKGNAIGYFQAGWLVKVYDKDHVLSWRGRALYPENVREGTTIVGKIKIIGVDSDLNNTYRKNYTTARSSTYILKDIIDNALYRNFFYDDEIDEF